MFIINVGSSKIKNNNVLSEEGNCYRLEFNSFDDACNFALSKAYEYFSDKNKVVFYEWQEMFGVFRSAQLSQTIDDTVVGSTITVEINVYKSWYQN
jgi:hypothetical protein